MDTHSRIQELANNSEIENSRNKSHAKISEFTVLPLACLSLCVCVGVCWFGCMFIWGCVQRCGWLGLLVTFLKFRMVNARVMKF